MTIASWRKILPVLKKKPAKRKKFLRHCTPKKRSCGRTTKACKRCKSTNAHISKYKLGLCRQCFREIATQIGFKQYS